VPTDDASTISTVRAELGSIADAVDAYKSRLSGLIDRVGANHEDLVSSMYEAERSLLSAQRLLVRAEKLAR
jgi:hypothetical protein